MERFLAAQGNLGRAQARHDLRIGNLVLAEVESAVLEEQYGIVVADGGAQQPERVGRIGRRHHLQARHVLKPCFQALGMLRAPAADCTLLKTDHHRNAELAAGHVTHLGGVIDQLAHGQGHEIDEHDLDDRPSSGESGTRREAHDAIFADRRIDHPPLAKATHKTRRHTKRTAHRHVLAKHDDV